MLVEERREGREEKGMVPVEWGMKRGAVNQCRTQDGAVRWVSKAGLYFHRNTQAHILMPPDKLGLPCHGQKKKKKRNCMEARWFYIGEGTAELCKNGGKISCILFLPS